MTEKVTRISGYIGRFLLWSVVLAGVYYFAFPYYERLVVALTEVVVDLGFRDVTLAPVSVGVASQGILFTDPQAAQPWGLPHNLFLICLNVIFAVALVLTTLGLTTKGVVRALGAVVIMVLLHTLQVTSVVYYYLTDPRNSVVPVDFAPWVTSAAPAVYNFFDKMADALFPFLAWVILCFGELARALYSRKGGEDQANPKS